jgi:Tfp pilus assembly protein PilO
MRYSRLIILICLVVSIIAWAVFIVPKYFQWQEGQKKLASQQSYLDNQTQYFSKISEIENKLQQSADVIGKIDSAIPNGIDFSTLVTFFEKTGKETGVIIKSINMGNQTIKAGQERLKENSFFISIVGTYAAFKNFLYKLENSARLFEVDEITFSNAKTGTDFFNYSLKLRAYSY